MSIRNTPMISRGFTLIELLVVIAIIAILAALLMPSLTPAKERVKSVACVSQRKQVCVASLQYEDDNGFLPTLHDGNLNDMFRSGLSEYLSKNTNTTLCTVTVKTNPEFALASGLAEARAPTTVNSWGNARLVSVNNTLGAGGYLLKEQMVAIKLEQIRHPAKFFYAGEGTFTFPPQDSSQGYWSWVFFMSPFFVNRDDAWYNGVIFPHRDRTVMGFLDGHVETLPTKAVLATNETVLRQWARDDELHPETR